MKPWLILIFLIALISCKRKDYYLLSVKETNGHDLYGYVNSKGDTIIPFGKYSVCYTDTFKKFAIVEKAKFGIVVINRSEKVLFNVFVFDNGPDYFSDGYFRIVKNGKMGYADSNFSVKIQPKYGCAFPFEKGIAKVSDSCKTIHYGEHSIWVSDKWYYINKAGVTVKN